MFLMPAAGIISIAWAAKTLLFLFLKRHINSPINGDLISATQFSN